MIYLQDPDVTIHQGDVLDELRNLPDESVHMCCTSPPFYGLRDYGTGTWEGGDPGCDHAVRTAETREKQLASTSLEGGKATVGHAKEGYRDTCPRCGARRVDQQIGLEATPDQYVARLVEVFREVRRVLRSDGTLWLEIGDSYNSAASNQQRGAETSTLAGLAPDSGLGRRPLVAGSKPKDLIGAPWLLAFALRADGWYLRSEIIWSKPNPMPESVTDRPTTSHSRVFLLSKQARYFYDADAIREPNDPASVSHHDRYGDIPHNGKRAGWPDNRANQGGVGYNPAGRNRRSVWTIATQPYPEAHFATWPEKLVEPMILAATSERGVCPECGAPWQRIVEIGELAGEARIQTGARPAADERGVSDTGLARTNGRTWRERHERGWQPGCIHSLEPIPATVLDPFAGSGTTAHIARKLGRRSIGIDLNADYLKLAARRLQQQSLFS